LACFQRLTTLQPFQSLLESISLIHRSTRFLGFYQCRTQGFQSTVL
jgi:hypothetical protein